MAIILDGKKLSAEILEDIRGKIKKSGKRLKLVAVLAGNDKNSLIFLRQKEKACKFVGVDFQLYQYPASISQEALEEEVKRIGGLENNGIIIQLPLPRHIDTAKILNLIPQAKDVDLLSGKIYSEKFLSPVLGGILELLKEYKINLLGKKVAVIGRGKLVGQPVIGWLKKKGIEVVEDIKIADVVISGVGKPGFVITGDMVKKGAVVVDAAGDAEQKSVAKKASYFTPTPGGIGPMTVAMLLKNLFSLNRS